MWSCERKKLPAAWKRAGNFQKRRQDETQQKQHRRSVHARDRTISLSKHSPTRCKLEYGNRWYIKGGGYMEAEFTLSILPRALANPEGLGWHMCNVSGALAWNEMSDQSSISCPSIPNNLSQALYKQIRSIFGSNYRCVCVCVSLCVSSPFLMCLLPNNLWTWHWVSARSIQSIVTNGRHTLRWRAHVRLKNYLQYFSDGNTQSLTTATK